MVFALRERHKHVGHTAPYPPPDGLADAESDGDELSLRDGEADPDRLDERDPDFEADDDVLWLVEGEVLLLVDSDRDGLVLADPDREADRDEDTDSDVLWLNELLWLALAEGDNDGKALHAAAARTYKTTPSGNVTGNIRITPDGTLAPVV
jgi:hypothetical protein